MSASRVAVEYWNQQAQQQLENARQRLRDIARGGPVDDADGFMVILGVRLPIRLSGNADFCELHDECSAAAEEARQSQATLEKLR